MKKKVLFYNGSLRMGGIERVLVEVLQNIDKSKIDIDLVIEDGTKTLNIFEKDIPKEIEIFYLKSEKLIKITDSFRKKKKNIFYKVAYNLLMNYESYVKKNNLKKLVKNKKYDVVIDFDMGLSKYIKIINVNKKIAWVHASIKNYDEDFIVAIARLTTHQKDFPTLIKGFKKAKELSNIPEKLLILGDGPDRKKIEKMIRDENMEKNIILLGSIKNPYPWLKKAKIFVHSSKYEGLPTVLIEALILNKKVISSACPTGPKEILENGKIGDLYEVGDYEKLAYYIIEALKNNSLDKELIKKEIQKFSKKEVIKEYEELILN